MLKLKLQYFGHLMWRTNSLKRPWYWERLKAGGVGDDRGWDGWMASLAQQTWVWVGSGSWWWTGKPGVLQAMGSQRVRHNWVTELNWTKDHLRYRQHAAAAKSLQLCLTLCNPRDSSPLPMEYFQVYMKLLTKVRKYWPLWPLDWINNGSYISQSPPKKQNQ